MGPLQPARHVPAGARPAGTDWRRASDHALIEHLLERYHAVHRQQLPALVRLARRVEQVHAAHPDCPHGLADLVASLGQEMESHMRKEEAVLFPLIARGHGTMATMPISVMRAEHEEHGDSLQRIAVLTRAWLLPPGACATWRALYENLGVFRDDLLEHIRLENDVLFERHAPAGLSGH